METRRTGSYYLDLHKECLSLVGVGHDQPRRTPSQYINQIQERMSTGMAHWCAEAVVSTPLEKTGMAT